jgi:YD repeat-containing protein
MRIAKKSISWLKAKVPSMVLFKFTFTVRIISMTRVKMLSALFFMIFMFAVPNKEVLADTITEPIRTFEGHTKPICFDDCLDFSSDGQFILSGSFDQTMKLWETSTGKEIRSFQQNSELSFVAFSPDEQLALSGSNSKNNSTMKLWNVSTGQKIHTFYSGEVYSATFSPDGQFILSGGKRTMKLWKVSTKQEIRTFSGHSQIVVAVRFSPDGQYALSGSYDHTIKLWRVSTGQEIRQFKGHPQNIPGGGSVSSVAFSPDGQFVLSGGYDHKVKLWRVSTGQEIRTFSGHSHAVYSVALSPDGQFALSGSHGMVKLWRVSTGQEIHTFKHLDGFPVLSVAFSPDGQFALSADKTMKLWAVGSTPLPTNHRPKIEIISAPSTVKAGQSYTIRLRASDPNNNLQRIKVDWTGYASEVTTKKVSQGQTVSFNYTYPRSGSFTWVASAVDSRNAHSQVVKRGVVVTSNHLTSRNTGFRASKRLRRSQPAQCRPNCLVADPIDTATGAQVLAHELLSVNGLLPISATLSYNSLLLTKGVVGRSWSLNGFDMRLQVLPSGDIEVHWSANRSNVFKNQGNGQFNGTDLVTLYDKLVSNADDSFTLTRQNKTVYQFDTNGWLVAFSNQKGQSLEFKHDNQGKLTQVTEPVSGVFLKYAYNNNGLLAIVTDSLNRQVSLGYDSEHNLVTITDAAGKTMTYTYNEFGQTLTGTNGDGVRLFTNTYDSEGRIIAQDDSVEGNQLFQLSYDETSQPNKIITTVTNRNGKARVFTYDENYQLLSLQNSLGKTTSYAYTNGRRRMTTDANGNITRFTYDSQGNLAAIINAANLSTFLSYDNRGNLLLVKNPLEQITRLAYDANNNVISQTDRAGQITQFEYSITKYPFMLTI